MPRLPEDGDHRVVADSAMKTIGLLGGMSWESTVPYYKIINRVVNERLGGLHSAKLVLYSVDFHDIEQCQRAGQWEDASRMLSAAAIAVESAGAELLVLCTNTMHKVAPQIERAVSIPLLHIADVTAEEIKACRFERVGLLGTKFTMEQAFYRERLEQEHALRVLVPGAEERETIHRVIYDELCLGIVSDASRAEYHRIIDRLVNGGAQAIVLGCTEISMLVTPNAVAVPVFDTTEIHARKAAQWALA